MAPHDQQPKPQPVEKFTCSSITASIWKNEGEKGAFYNVTITRSYKTADGWKRSDSFSLNDLEAVTVVLGRQEVSEKTRFRPLSFRDYFASLNFFLLVASRFGGGPIGSKFFNNGTSSFFTHMRS